MATIRMRYMVLSCPNCHTRLLKVPAGTTIIGSPLLQCKSCGRTYRTDLREEWYKYGQKWQLIGIPLIAAGVMLLVGALMENLAIGILAAALGFIIGLYITLKDVVRMIKSKKRMRSAAYLKQLLAYRAITPEDYERFMREAA
ncbi:MAG: hypothetical protein IJ507_00495 [Clostridia bacterium]|nr:hypothetical protein [Clostridia bacterium]